MQIKIVNKIEESTMQGIISVAAVAESLTF